MSAAAAKTDETKPASDAPEAELAAGGGGAESAGQKVADATRAEVASVVKTEPKDVKDGDAVLVDSSTAVGEELIDAGQATHVTITKPVYEKFYFPDTKRPSFRIKFHPGQLVSRAQIDAHNARVQANRNADKQSDEDKQRAKIDSSTLHSGTHPGLGEQK